MKNIIIAILRMIETPLLLAAMLSSYVVSRPVAWISGRDEMEELLIGALIAFPITIPCVAIVYLIEQFACLIGAPSPID